MTIRGYWIPVFTGMTQILDSGSEAGMTMRGYWIPAFAGMTPAQILKQVQDDGSSVFPKNSLATRNSSKVNPGPRRDWAGVNSMLPFFL